MLRLIGEIGLHDQHCVATRVSRLGHDRTAQRVQCPSIADVALATQDAEGKNVAIWLERFARRIGAAVVEHDNLVLAREVPQDFANTPEQDADGRRFVVRRNADVQHVVAPRIGEN